MSNIGVCRTAPATPGLFKKKVGKQRAIKVGTPEKKPFNLKLDGVGPVDNRPFTDLLHCFVNQ